MGVVVTVRVMWRRSCFFGRPAWEGAVGRSDGSGTAGWAFRGRDGWGSSVCLKRASELTAFLLPLSPCTGALVSSSSAAAAAAGAGGASAGDDIAGEIVRVR